MLITNIRTNSKVINAIYQQFNDLGHVAIVVIDVQQRIKLKSLYYSVSLFNDLNCVNSSVDS